MIKPSKLNLIRSDMPLKENTDNRKAVNKTVTFDLSGNQNQPKIQENMLAYESNNQTAITTNRLEPDENLSESNYNQSDFFDRDYNNDSKN